MKHLTLSFERGVETVTLNRPEVRNAFNDEVIAELTAVFGELAKRDEVRCIVLAGNGPAFVWAGCPGAWRERGYFGATGPARAMHGLAIGWLRTMTDSGQILGPLVMGACADAVDLSTPFHLGAALLLAAAWRCGRQGRLTPAPATTGGSV